MFQLESVLRNEEEGRIQSILFYIFKIKSKHSQSQRLVTSQTFVIGWVLEE